MDLSVRKTNGKEDFKMFNSITKVIHCWADFSLKQINSNYSLTSGYRNHYILKIFIAKYSLKKVSIYNFLLVEHSRKYLIIDIFCKWRNKLETGFSVSAQK